MIRGKSLFVCMIAAVLLAASLAMAEERLTTTVDKVWANGDITTVETPRGVFELDYEAGVEATGKATQYLQSIAGSDEAVTFTWFPDQRSGKAIQVITRQSVSEFAAKRIYAGNAVK